MGGRNQDMGYIREYGLIVFNAYVTKRKYKRTPNLYGTNILYL